MIPGRRAPGRPSAALLSIGGLTASALALALFHAVLEERGLYRLDLGEIGLPAGGYGYFLWIWTTCGSLAVAFAAVALADMQSRLAGSLTLPEHSPLRADALWITVLALLAFLVAALLHLVVLGQTRLTDDEAAYEFSARLLASGRLHGTSPPLPVFWQRAFFIDDGKWYSQFFLGWPALMVPGVWFGAEGLMNPLYGALTVPPLYLATRSLTGSVGARLACALFITSPMLAIGNATKMAHTSCACALAWAYWSFARARGERHHPGWDAALAFFLSAAFFVRPQTTIALGPPLIAAWLFGLRGDAARRFPRLAAFAVPALAMAALFLAANQALTGGFFYPPFLRAVDQSLSAGHVFTQVPPGIEDLPDLRFDPWHGALMLGAGLLRFNVALYGWPCSLGLAVMAIGARGSGVAWGMLGCGLFALLFAWTPGIDTFGPTHYFELALPVTLLSAVGFVRAQDWLRSHADAFGRAAPIVAELAGAVVLALVLVTAAGYTPVRLANVARIAAAVRGPEQIVQSHGIHHALLFGMRPFSPCLARPTQHFVYWPPANDPDLSADVLWANHLTTRLDRRLLREHFPTRKGYVYWWGTDCALGIFDLDDPASDALPANRELPAGWSLP